MKTPHAIIVDDNPDNLLVLGTLLEMENVEHTPVQDPAHFSNAIADLPHIEVIFLDLELPEIDGYQLYEQIRRDERLKHVPVVAYSVHTNQIQRTRQLGFQGFLSKPLNAEAFPHQLTQILNGQLVWAA